MENLEPRQMAFAYCSRGELGLITSAGPISVHYTDRPECICAAGASENHLEVCPVFKWLHNPANHGIAWAGIHLSPEKFGQPWSSRTPRVVGEIKKDLWEHRNGFILKGRNQSRAFLHL